MEKTKGRGALAQINGDVAIVGGVLIPAKGHDAVAVAKDCLQGLQGASAKECSGPSGFPGLGGPRAQVQNLIFETARSDRPSPNLKHGRSSKDTSKGH